MASKFISRRSFLASLSVAAAGVIVAACSPAPSPTATSAPAAATPTTAAAKPTTAAATPAVGAATPTTAAAKPTTAAATPGTVATTAPKTGTATGTVVWLVRASVNENKGQDEIFDPTLKAQLPGITVNRIVVPDAQYQPKINTMAAGGEALDIWGFGQNYYDYWARGMLADLSPFITGDKWDTAAYFQPGLMEIFKIGGKYYGLPQLSCFGTALVYNKDMFDQAGIPYPPVDWDDASWTVDKMVEVAGKLTKNFGKPDATYGIAWQVQLLTMQGYMWGTDNFLPEHYKNLIAPKTNYNTPENIAGHQWRADLIYKHKVHPDPAVQQGLSQLGDPFQTGRIAMNANGGWIYWTISAVEDFKFAYAALPKAATNKNVNYNDFWEMGSASKVKDATWQVMRVLTSVDATTRYSVQSGTPPTPRESYDAWVTSRVKKTGMTVEELKKVTTGAIDPKRSQESPDHLFAQWQQISTAYNNEVDPLWKGTVDAKTLIPTLTASLDKVVGQIYEQFKDKIPKT